MQNDYEENYKIMNLGMSFNRYENATNFFTKPFIQNNSKGIK